MATNQSFKDMPFWERYKLSQKIMKQAKRKHIVNYNVTLATGYVAYSYLIKTMMDAIKLEDETEMWRTHIACILAGIGVGFGLWFMAKPYLNEITSLCKEAGIQE